MQSAAGSALDRPSGLVIGIDASNIRAGGGLTHLCQMLAAVDQRSIEGLRMVVWGGRATIAKLPDRTWLTKKHEIWLDRGAAFRILWQQVGLARAARLAKCRVIFSPGGSVPIINRIPCVTMSQNLLPFEVSERRRFGVWRWMYWKLLLLRLIQGLSFRRAAGVIFLSEFARNLIRAKVSIQRHSLVPHGVESRFFQEFRRSRMLKECSESEPFKILYVSNIDVYKHQDKVAEAVARLIQKGLAIRVEFVGPAYGPALSLLVESISRFDAARQFLHYRGAEPFEQLHETYRRADMFVFASSCENLPNTLLEAMASGLPIACSNRGPMPELLGDAGVYFDPERPEEIADAIEGLLRDHAERARLAQAAQARARHYTWERCARETVEFIYAVVRRQ